MSRTEQKRELARDNRTLGHFRLEGIRPAQRSLPQIEVTFDIDTNGILKVTARDKGTGKAQEITISGSTQLSRDEIDRMVSDAQGHAEEDRRRHEEVEARNAANSAAYQAERQMEGPFTGASTAFFRRKALCPTRASVTDSTPCGMKQQA